MKRRDPVSFDLRTTPSGSTPSVASKFAGGLRIAIFECGLIPSFSTSDLFEYPAVIGAAVYHAEGCHFRFWAHDHERGFVCRSPPGKLFGRVDARRSGSHR